MVRRLALAIAVVVLALGPVTGARAAASPQGWMHEALAYRSVVEAGDLYVIIRYALDVTGWCDYLVYDDGCAETPPQPTEPASLPIGYAMMAFYTDWTGTPLLQDRVPVPRIEDGLGGIYFGSGHGFTWGNGDVRVCLEASDTVFDPAGQACLGPSWRAGTDTETDTAQAALVVDLPNLMRRLEQARLYPQGTLVNAAGDITIPGRVFATEALTVIDRLIPDAFQTSLEAALETGYTPVAGESALQAQLDAAPSTLRDSLDIFAEETFGMAGATFLLFAVLFCSVATAGLVYHTTKETILASFAFFVPIMAGTYLRAPTVAVLFALIAILTIPTAAVIVRKFP